MAKRRKKKAGGSAAAIKKVRATAKRIANKARAKIR